jgi:hypothetical protein
MGKLRSRRTPSRPPVDPRVRIALARAAAAYCALALLACLWVGKSYFGQWRAAGGRLHVKEAALAKLKPQADQAEATYRQLVDEQENERRNYSGPEAVAMSMRIQTAKEGLDAAAKAAREAEAGAAADREALRMVSLRFVPLVAIFLIHLLLLGLVASGNALFSRRQPG